MFNLWVVFHKQIVMIINRIMAGSEMPTKLRALAQLMMEQLWTCSTFRGAQRGGTRKVF